MANTGMLNPEGIDFNTIKDALQSYVESRPDYSTWTDFIDSGAGQTIIELLAGVSSLLNYHAIGARREASFEYAQLTNSVIALASNLDYPVNRATAPRLTLDIQNTSTSSIFWNRTTPLAFYGNLNVSLAQSATFLPSTTTQVECLIGDWNSFSYTAVTATPFSRLLVEDTNIDNDPDRETNPSSNYKLNELTVNGTPIGLYRFSEDLLDFEGVGYNDRVVIKTHPDGVLLVFGDGIIGRQLNTNDVVQFNYVTSEGQSSVTSLLPSQLSSNNDDLAISAVNITDVGSFADSLEKISVLAPAYRSSKRRMVTAEDHANILMAYSGSIVSAHAEKKDDVCCTAQIAYLFLDEHVITTTEEETIQNYLKEFKMVGMEIELLAPTKVGLDIRLDIVLEEGATVVEQDILDIIDEQTFKLGFLAKPGILTQQISVLDGVKQVYISKPLSDLQLAFNEYLKIETSVINFIYDQGSVIDITPEDWGYIFDWKSSTSYGLGQKVYYDDGGGVDVYQANQAHTSSATFALDNGGDNDYWDEV